MRSDGQLYNRKSRSEPPLPPPIRQQPEEKDCDCEELTCVPLKRGLRIGEEELLIIGIIILLLSGRENADMPLVLALLYILFWK